MLDKTKTLEDQKQTETSMETDETQLKEMKSALLDGAQETVKKDAKKERLI